MKGLAPDHNTIANFRKDNPGTGLYYIKYYWIWIKQLKYF
jgi:hypothetical protein